MAASDTVQQRPVAVADADAAAVVDIGSVMPVRASCRNLAALGLECVAYLAVAPSEHVHFLRATPRQIRRPLRFHCQSLVRGR